MNINPQALSTAIFLIGGTTLLLTIAWTVGHLIRLRRLNKRHEQATIDMMARKSTSVNLSDEGVVK
ncbi:hypothetical protein LCGC14_2734380 [marine sediment metagenome]|uniref:Uncharacterized protein n=1 Tax=marine sediment metagenome TaxID=412755 RepID=A0A0F8ZTK9_9ZZZZ